MLSPTRAHPDYKVISCLAGEDDTPVKVLGLLYAQTVQGERRIQNKKLTALGKFLFSVISITSRELSRYVTTLFIKMLFLFDLKKMKIVIIEYR